MPSVSHLDPLINPDFIARLFLVRIAAFHSGGGTVTGDTIISVDAHNGGVPTPLGQLTLDSGLAAFEVANIIFTSENQEDGVPITASDNMVIMAVGTDGGHRNIFATAYFAQIPLRR